MTDARYDDDVKKDKLEGQDTANTSEAKESSVAYNYDDLTVMPSRRDVRERKKKSEDVSNLMASPSQLAATSEGGDDMDMDKRYFEKYIDQRMASIDEKYANIQLTIQQSLQEMRERDNQRHAELLSMNAGTDARFDNLDAHNDARFNSIDTRFDNIDSRFDNLIARIDARFDNLIARNDARFNSIDAKFNSIDTRFDNIDSRFDNLIARIDARFDNINARNDARFNSIDARFNNLNARYDARFDSIDVKFEQVNEEMRWILNFVVGTALTAVGILITLFFK